MLRSVSSKGVWLLHRHWRLWRYLGRDTCVHSVQAHAPCFCSDLGSNFVPATQRLDEVLKGRQLPALASAKQRWCLPRAGYAGCGAEHVFVMEWSVWVVTGGLGSRCCRVFALGRSSCWSCSVRRCPWVNCSPDRRCVQAPKPAATLYGAWPCGGAAAGWGAEWQSDRVLCSEVLNAKCFSFACWCPDLGTEGEVCLCNGAGFVSRLALLIGSISMWNTSYRKRVCARILARCESWQKVRSAMALRPGLGSQAVIHAVPLKKIRLGLRTWALMVAWISRAACSGAEPSGSKLCCPHVISEGLGEACALSRYPPKLYSLENWHSFTSLDIQRVKAQRWYRNRNWIFTLTVLCPMRSYVLGRGGEKKWMSWLRLIFVLIS